MYPPKAAPSNQYSKPNAPIPLKAPSAQTKIQEALASWGLKEGQIVSLDGKLYITSQGILEHAQTSGQLAGIQMELLQLGSPQEGVPCVMKCTVRLKDGATFEDFGDSENCKKIPPIRMASTRARTRALKLAFAIPFAVAEE